MTNWTPNSAMVHKYAVGAALFLGLILGAGGASHAVDIKVSATGNIQNAINQCPDNDATGCRILLQGRKYTLANALFIRGKNNLTLMAASSSIRPTLIFQDDGSKEGPFDLKDVADSMTNRPAGWKRWPLKQDALVGGSLNTSNPYSTSGIQHNGAILIKNSHDIVIDGIVIDGKKPIGYGSLGIWDTQGYPTFYGNVGINLFFSGRVTVRNSEIKNCFAAFYIFNRNKGGALAHNNQADLDKGDLAPGSRYGEMGGHVVEYSSIHHNVWAAYEESGFDLGTTWRFNKLWELHNTSADFASWMSGKSSCFDRTNATGIIGSKTCDNSESKNHVGGFIYLKDNVSVPERVYNNTFWRVSSLFGWGGWRGGVGHAFYNNIIADPWLDYNKDSTGFLTGNFVEYMTGFQNLTKDMSEFVRSNTFAYFPVIEPSKTNLSATGCPGGAKADSCLDKLAALKAKVWPPTRLSFQSQQVQGTNYNGQYVQPTSKYYYIDGVQYQGQERKFIFQPWTLEEPNKTIDKVDYKTMLPASQNSTPVGLVEFSYTGRDSNQIAPRFGGIRGLPLADTVGRLLKLGNSMKDMTSFNNHYIKSLPLITDTASPNFLSLDWTDKGVDSVVLADVWAPQGYGFTNATGALAARGAVQPDGVAGVQKLTISDDQPALIVGKVATLSFNLSASVSGLTNLQWVHGQYIPNVPVTDGLQTYTGDYAPVAIPASSFSNAPTLGANTVAIQLPVAAGAYSRIDVVVAGTSATGEKVMSNLAIWLVRKSDYSFDVRFFKTKGDTSKASVMDTVRAGYPVWMRVEPMHNTTNIMQIPSDSCAKLKKKNPTASCDYAEIQNTPYKADLGTYSIKANSMWDVDPSTAGASAVPGDALYKNGTYVPTGTGGTEKNVAWIQVWFTKAGMAAPMHTALALTSGKADTGKVFQGVGLIYVRPGDPYIAELRDPASYRLMGDNDSLPMISTNSKSKAFIDVKDKYGNIVDVPTKITLSAITWNGTGALEPTVKVGDLTASTGVVDVPATGTVQTFVQASTSPFVPMDLTKDWFWLKSWIGATAAPDVGTVPDSSRVHVAKAERILMWVKDDSIYREIRDTAHVSLGLYDGKGDIVSDKNYFVKIGSVSKQVKFYLPSDVARANPLDSVAMDGLVELVVSSNVPVNLDSIYAYNEVLNSGEFVVQDSVTFYYTPPPFPLVDTAAFVDTNCDGAADQLRVWLKAGGFGGIDTLDTTKVKFKGMALQVGTATITYDSSEMSYYGTRKNAFAFPLKGITSSLASVSGNVSVVFALKRKNADDSLVFANEAAGVFAIDRVSPRIDSAVVMENYSSAQDEFYVRFTEPVTFAGTAWPLVTKTGSVLNNTAAVSVVSFTPDADALLGPNTYKVVVTGNRNAAFDPLYIHYTDSVQLSLLSQVIDASNNGGDGCAKAVMLSVRSVLPSFSGAIWTDDSLGQANRLTVKFSRALKAEERIDSLAVAFGGVVRTVYTANNWSSSDRTTWTLTMPYPFPYGLTRGSADASYGASVVVFGTNTGSGATSYLPRAGLVRDSVPVVFVNKSGVGTPMIAINYGKDVDTLIYELSEPVVDIPTGRTGLRVAASGAEVAMVGQTLLGPTSVMMIQSTLAPANKLQPSDWALLGDKLIGADGVMPAVIKPSKALVVGGDRGPQDAIYVDADADGIADGVYMTFGAKLKTSPSFVFRIGGESRTVDVSNGLVIAADGLSAAVDFRVAAPFNVVQTYVTANDFGTMTSSMAGVAAVTHFVVRDGIAPIILRADLTYASYSDAEHMDDTLRLKLSEPVALASTKTNLAWFIGQGALRTSQSPILQKGIGTQIGADEVLIFVDTSKAYTYLGAGDSVRVAPSDAAGEMTDLYGNAPTVALAKWTKVNAGQRPLRFSVDIFPTPLMVIDPVTHPDVNGMSVGPQMSVYVTSIKAPGVLYPMVGNTVGTTPISGAMVAGNAIGPKFTVNGPIEATALVYDNLGVFVGQITVNVTQQMIDNGTFAGKDGSFEVVILWNGRNLKNLPVGSGIYMFRVVVYRDQEDMLGNKKRAMVLNQVTKVGIKSATK